MHSGLWSADSQIKNLILEPICNLISILCMIVRNDAYIFGLTKFI